MPREIIYKVHDVLTHSTYVNQSSLNRDNIEVRMR